MIKYFFVLLLVLFVNKTNSANILGIFHFPSQSHHILGSSLLKALAAKGHHVTMISAFPLKKPVKNYEDLALNEILNHKDSFVKELITLENKTFLDQMALFKREMETVDTLFFESKALKDLLTSKKKIDLVVLNWFANDAYLGISHALGAHTVAFSVMGSANTVTDLTGCPTPFSYVPNMSAGYPDTMTFYQRAVNTLSYLFFDVLNYFYMHPRAESLLKKYFPGAPPLDELRSNISLVLLNSHYSIESPRPYVPAMIQVGGLQLEEPKELTGDLKTFMDSAKEGVIFFSLGSNARSQDLPENVLEAIVAAFAKIDMKILWKFESDLPNLPKNVKISKWLPQRDILAHPNLKLFITHGGLLSTTEAVYHGMPMVGLPVFGDQQGNVDAGVVKGYLVKEDLLTLTEEKLTNAIKEVLNNPKYRENIQARSRILRDQPVKPIDNAVFWVEYVLRHKGAPHLKVAGLKLAWYQYYILDVVALFATVIVLVIAIPSLIVYKIFKCLCKCKKETKAQTKASKKIKQKKA